MSYLEGCLRVSACGAAQVLATLRNVALGLYELTQARGATRAPGLTSCGRQRTFATALAWLRR
jgi:hypothetical protein